MIIIFISELLSQKKPLFSFEIFPPKKSSSIDKIYETIDALAPLSPDFISVTYGAGGSTSRNTLEIASMITKKYNMRALAHLTCVGSSPAQIDEVLDNLHSNGVKNILALRGDIPAGQTHTDVLQNDFLYASNLASHIAKTQKFCIAGACYPEKHAEAVSMEEDIENLKLKVDSGVEFLISQLFFDNEVFYNWVKQVRNAGITVPIIAGIMPITSARQLERIIPLCGATIPPGITRLVEAYNKNSQSLKDAGIAYATSQIMDLLAYGVDGIHLYTMNQASIAQKINDNLRSVLYLLKSN